MQIHKVAKTMEKVWLVLAILSTIIGIYHLYTFGFEQSRMYVLIPIFIWIWYFVRMKVRKRLESTFEQRQEDENT